ncbi:Gp37 family protein [Chromobacterium sp. IIBBL 290-4]|uniref:Gp37 family protein n=1 Tax=Chromobacterium sp. IIBBL 290-4 TaxID=2953890 RepID=UPI0020B7A3F8|nr:Gp37 family protein [Chromobacterium sp. IIBBL 290-4]UTH73976.1 Gp37 family protein [Chromobacterium sp. IIBBL 290-4]
MAATIEIIDALAARLQARLPSLAVEYFPERPAEYRLNHPAGALLVSYLGSQFAAPVDAGIVAQPRTVKLSVTVVLRQLNGRTGAVAVLDDVRRALVGYRLPDCRKLQAAGERFLGQTAGLWQYAVDFTALAMQVEEDDTADSPVLSQVNHEEQA